MKTLKFIITIMAITAFFSLNEVYGQWGINGTHIYNTNTGYVGIGNSSPAKLLYVGKNMTEPTITIRNYGGTGGATFQMVDDASGADWKFKATNPGGFKIRDNANALDVITVDPGSFANAIYIKSTDNIGIGTATPASTALVDMSSTDKGLLPPRMTQAQIGSITNPADGLQVYCTTDGKMYIFVATANQWKELAYGAGTINPPPPSFTCGDSITINHIAGNIAPVTKTTTYGTVNNIPGEPTKCWITQNLGADHQASSVSDNTEASAGWYWQFNRMQGYKHDGSTVTPSWTITSINENSDWLADNDPCNIELGSPWRLPTSTEYYDIDNTGGWGNWNGPWSSALKMHAAGNLLNSDGSLDYRGTDGYYWCSTQNDNSDGWYLTFYSGSCYMNYSNKAYGFTTRCLRDF